MSIQWSELIAQNPAAVRKFAEGTLSKDAFRAAFSNGGPNMARQAVVTLGADVARKRARTALRRRGIAV
jgi:hypothetical protein